MTERERQALIASYSGWAPKHLLEAIEQTDSPSVDNPKPGRKKKDDRNVKAGIEPAIRQGS